MYIFRECGLCPGLSETGDSENQLIEPEGTYLLWLDCRELGLSVEELEHLVVDKANLWLDPGFIFGAVGEGFERINIACPRQTLKQAMDQLRDALNAETFLN